MSSRFDGDGPDDQWAAIRWRGAAKQAFKSKYGVERLRELETALLALPRRRLIQGHLIEPLELGGWAPWEGEGEVEPGDVCVVGAFCAYKLGHGDMALGLRNLLSERLADNLEYESDSDTAEAGLAQGMRLTMAWELAYLNDEELWGMSPEDRYDRVLAFVRGKIAAASG